MSYAEAAARRLRSPEFDRWMRGAASTGFCHNPVRLVGASTTLRQDTGEVLGQYASASEPDGLTFTRPESCRFSALRWRRECRRREGWAGWSR